MRRLPCSLVWSLLVWANSGVAAEEPLTLHARERKPDPDHAEALAAAERVITWNPKRTAIVICDMWDRHWCRGATARVAEMAPRMNEVLKSARQRGVLIIHAPSDTMKFYADYPQRRRAQQASKASPPADAAKWKSLDRDKEGPLPIDDRDGGCDDQPACVQGGPWRSQIATLEILPEDVISDSGEEIYNVLRQLGIENVIVMGVHTNMCVLGRSFAIRSLVGLGLNVALMRDLTDTMYNSRSRPWVSHFAGTDLVLAHIERYWCPTITSADFLGGQPFRFQADRRPRIVFVIGENEYRTWESLPAFGERVLSWRGLDLGYVTASTRIDDYDFQHADRLPEADLVIVSARRRALPVAMFNDLQRHLAAGKPLIGIRTASHAFAVSADQLKPAGSGLGLTNWPGFDAEVLGGNYHGHHPAGPRTTVAAVESAAAHPVLVGVAPGALESSASLYRTGPLKPSAQPILMGSIPGQAPEPLAWTQTYGPKNARIVYTSLGNVDDFANPAFRRLLLNAVLWTLDQPIPPAEASADHP